MEDLKSPLDLAVNSTVSVRGQKQNPSTKEWHVKMTGKNEVAGFRRPLA